MYPWVSNFTSAQCKVEFSRGTHGNFLPFALSSDSAGNIWAVGAVLLRYFL